MEKIIRKVKKGEDEGNLLYWLSLSYQERMRELERLREEVITNFYGTEQGFQRVYRIIERE